MTGYEAKVYTALVSASTPLNGYEAAKRAQVPRSMVYQTLAKLVENGVAYEVDLDRGTAYLALPPETLLEKLNRDFESSAKLLAEVLPSLAAASQEPLARNINGHGAVLDKAQELIRTANKDLYLALWQQETEYLSDAIREAESRGVEVFLLTFGNAEGPVRHARAHRLVTRQESSNEEIPRLMIVAVGHDQVLIGGAGKSTWALWSDSPAVVLVAVEYVRHDMGLQRLAEMIGIREMTKLWETDAELKLLSETRGGPGFGPEKSAAAETKARSVKGGKPANRLSTNKGGSKK